MPLSEHDKRALRSFVAAARRHGGLLYVKSLADVEAQGLEPAVARARFSRLMELGLLARKQDRIREANPLFRAEEIPSFLVPSVPFDRYGRPRLIEKEGDPYWELTQAGAEAYEAESSADDGSPEAAWEPLPLDRDPPALDAAISATQELLDRVSGDNGFAANAPERRRAILWSLRAGLDALRSKMPSSEQLRALLISPMRWLVDNFSKGAIGELAKQAVQAVGRLLGWTT